tara:strand:+ start:4887 stop:5345 length:459 start_codon:yes stop_codon:yes gene_type:complete
MQTLSTTEIEDRFEEAAQTLRRLPGDRIGGYASSWPPIVRDAREAYGYNPQRMPRIAPSPQAISRMEECFDWLGWLDDPEDARIVWLRAEGVRWRQICIRIGCVRSTAWRRWATALLMIQKRLAMPPKAPKAKAPRNPPAATNGSRPRAGLL